MPETPDPDATELLVSAIRANRALINAELSPFVGRISFVVELDCNVPMVRVDPRVRRVQRSNAPLTLATATATSTLSPVASR